MCRRWIAAERKAKKPKWYAIDMAHSGIQSQLACHAGTAAPIEDVVEVSLGPNFSTGFDHTLQQGWRLLVGRPVCEKEFGSKMSFAPTDDDSDPCKRTFPDGHVLSLAERTLGQQRARTAMPATKGKALCWSDVA